MEKGSDFIIYILAILSVLCDGPSSYAQEDASYCSTYTFEMIAGDSVRLIREDDSSTFTGQISQKVDLNLDGLDDFIINFGICGNWGDCVYGIYVQQTDQTHGGDYEGGAGPALTNLELSDDEIKKIFPGMKVISLLSALRIA